MKSLIKLVDAVLYDIGDQCCVNTQQDRKTILSRIEQEGIAFLTITLPAFAKDFERSLELRQVGSSMFRGFSKHKELPRFLGGFLELVFDRFTGRLLDMPDIAAIRCVRQLTLMFAKIALPTTLERNEAAINKYVECEHDLNSLELPDTSFGIGSLFQRMSSIIGAPVWRNLSEAVDSGTLIPRHGPGSTADKLFGNEKFLQTAWPARLELLFPAYRMLAHNGLRAVEVYDDIEIVEPGEELPVKITLVPKTQSTPRIIAMEPTAVQYVQQALLSNIAHHIKRDNLLNDMISLDDQEPNRVLARLGSISGTYATLDLSEASDRVSLSLVERMLDKFPTSLEAVLACRSTRAKLPDGRIIDLKKFASMGSALCFPMEALCFLTIVVSSIIYNDLGEGFSELNDHELWERFHALKGRVRVFGDDIIIPNEYAADVMRDLEAFGLKINERKSFMNGEFRESCGGDFYKGEWVTPVRMRRMLPDNIKTADEVVSSVSLRNQMYKNGYWKVVRFLDNLIESFAPFPAVEDTSSTIGKHTFLPVSGDRMCDKLHRPMVRGMHYVTLIPNNSIVDNGYACLLKWFLEIKRGELYSDSEYEGSLFEAEDHLRRSGRPNSARISIRWGYTY